MTTMSDLVLSHYAAMRHYALRLTKNPDLAEDVTQAACVSALGSDIVADDIDNPGAWLNRCVKHAFFAVVKKVIKPGQLKTELLPDSEAFAVDGAQEASLDLHNALDAVDTLIPRHRELVLMSAAGWGVVELADMFGSSKQAISQSLQRARAHLLAA